MRSRASGLKVSLARSRTPVWTEGGSCLTTRSAVRETRCWSCSRSWAQLGGSGADWGFGAPSKPATGFSPEGPVPAAGGADTSALGTADDSWAHAAVEPASASHPAQSAGSTLLSRLSGRMNPVSSSARPTPVLSADERRRRRSELPVGEGAQRKRPSPHLVSWASLMCSTTK